VGAGERWNERDTLIRGHNADVEVPPARAVPKAAIRFIRSRIGRAVDKKKDHSAKARGVAALAVCITRHFCGVSLGIVAPGGVVYGALSYAMGQNGAILALGAWEPRWSDLRST
jgi:hypothetical protein